MGCCVPAPNSLPCSLSSARQEDVYELYQVQELLGTGNSGRVRLARAKSAPHKQFAIKSLQKSDFVSSKAL